jgi:hypothetical protein
MAKKAKGNGRPSSSARWLAEQNDDFWQRLQVYPNAVIHATTKADYERKALSQVKKLGRANLRYIADAAGIAYRAQVDSADQLANRVFTSAIRTELIYLATFLRPRVSAVVEFFESHATQMRSTALESDIANLSLGAAETPKPLTKLLTIYRNNPDDLESIHYRYAWRRLPTLFEFSTAASLNEDASGMMEKSVKELIKSLNKLKQGETYSFFGRRELEAPLSIFVLHRNYPPSVRPDYASDFRFQHDFSMVVFAIDAQRKSLFVKVANRAIGRVIADWAGDVLGCSIVRAGGSVFADYKPESVEQALLGGYDESHGLDVTAVEFRHSFAPNHSRISLSAIPLSPSIREDLLWMKSEGILRLRSLADIASLRIRFDGAEAEVACDVEKEGAIRLRLDDSNIPDERTERLKNAFRDTFGVPLEQRIDPTLLTMGTTEIFQFLLSGVSEDQVLDYHKESLGKLLDWELIKSVELQIGHCTDQNCSAKNQELTNTSITECPACQGKVAWATHKRYEEDSKGVAALTRKLVAKATGWKFANEIKKFESHAFYRLFPKRDPNRTVCVFINNRLKATKIETFQRAMFPILVVHPLGNHRMPVLDASGIAHVGLPYALAALDDDTVWKKFREGCKDVVQRLLRTENERVLRTSRHSYENLKQRPSEYDDRKYEADVFNILRSLFPYTVRWGGARRPDGFSSLVYFPANDLSAPTKFNWSYDAKYTDSVYPFGIAEFRQMFDYIRALYQPKRMKSDGNSYDGHAIITNSMEDSAMKNAADYLWNQHRLGREQTAFLLIFIRDGFITQLWKRVRDEEVAFGKRSTYLSEFLVKFIMSKQRDGFSLLDSSVADELADDIRRQPEVESPLDHDALKEDLKGANKLSSKLGVRSRSNKKNAAK